MKIYSYVKELYHNQVELILKGISRNINFNKILNRDF